jgi:hypothetical protein
MLTCLFKMLNHLRFISKILSSIKNAVKRNSSLKDIWFARKKNCVKRADAKTKTRMKQTCTIAEFWSPLFAQTQMTYLTFIFLTLQTLTKLKTTFGRNLLYGLL